MEKQPIRLIHLNEVLAMTGLSRSTLYKQIGERNFPYQVQLGARAVAWVESEVQQWIAQRAASRVH